MSANLSEKNENIIPKNEISNSIHYFHINNQIYSQK